MGDVITNITRVVRRKGGLSVSGTHHRGRGFYNTLPEVGYDGEFIVHSPGSRRDRQIAKRHYVLLTDYGYITSGGSWDITMSKRPGHEPEVRRRR